MDKRFYRFLQATCCNWRNSFFIDCQRCDGCSGFLLSVNHNAVPSIIPVAVFEELSGETVDKYDCVGIMTLEGFQRFYTSWLVWNVEDPKRCSLSSLLTLLAPAVAAKERSIRKWATSAFNSPSVT